MRTGDAIARLQNWYLSVCNGDWEHTYGLFIDNIDNPGWALRVQLTDTYLSEVPFSKVSIQREAEDDWLVCSREGDEFKGYCGPLNLNELIETFLDWAEAHD